LKQTVDHLNSEHRL